MPDLRDEGQAADHETERRPHAAPHRLVPGEPDPERDQHRGAELEEQADPDRQALDRDEVEPLHDREADDPVEREPSQLAARPDPQPVRRDEREAERQPDEAARRAELGPAERAHVARLETDLGDGAVDREHRRGHDRHRVPDARPAVAGKLSRWQRELGHRSRLDDLPLPPTRGGL